MAFPEFLITGWQTSVRNACFGVSAVDVSDALLSDDPYGPESEDHVKQEIPTWADLKVAKATELHRAVYYYIAAKVCKCLAGKLSRREVIGNDFSFELQAVDWNQHALEMLEKSNYYLELACPGTRPTLTAIDVAQHDPPIYEELEVETE